MNLEAGVRFSFSCFLSKKLFYFLKSFSFFQRVDCARTFFNFFYREGYVFPKILKKADYFSSQCPGFIILLFLFFCVFRLSLLGLTINLYCRLFLCYASSPSSLVTGRTRVFVFSQICFCLMFFFSFSGLQK